MRRWIRPSRRCASARYGDREQRAFQLDERVAIVFLLEQPPAAIEIETGELLLIALIPGRERRFDLARAWQLDVALDPLEPFRHRVGAPAAFPTAS